MNTRYLLFGTLGDFLVISVLGALLHCHDISEFHFVAIVGPLVGVRIGAWKRLPYGSSVLLIFLSLASLFQLAGKDVQNG